ncbi:MAG TPA: DeoR family transcriptional regulator [Streptosporangiaceae bacterium]|nr:DeoR family transcriptional regulator [Streptosporangiaceae bacterium]
MTSRSPYSAPPGPGRRGFIHDGLMLGYNVRQIAEYLEVSVSTVRRDLRQMPLSAAAARRQLSPDAARWTPPRRHLHSVP